MSDGGVWPSKESPCRRRRVEQNAKKRQRCEDRRSRLRRHLALKGVEPHRHRHDPRSHLGETPGDSISEEQNCWPWTAAEAAATPRDLHRRRCPPPPRLLRSNGTARSCCGNTITTATIP